MLTKYSSKNVFFGMFKKPLVLCLALLLFIPLVMKDNRVYAKEDEHENDLDINPAPQEVEKLGKGFPLTPVVGVITGENTDEAAVREVEQALKEADVKRIVRKTAEESEPNTPVTIWIGGPTENQESPRVIEELGVDGPEQLQAEGYVIASTNKQKKQIVLAGKDRAGTFYAAQTFEQMIQERKGRDWIPAVEIRDWPDMSMRGSIEGFYGPPWSHEDRLSQLEFYSENKMNAYIYAPKDDPYHREKWREPYPEEELNQLRELVDKAKANHVEFTFSLSPGNTVCYSGDKDFDQLMSKMQTVWDLGVRSYAIFLDDISYNLHCEQDKQKFGDDPNPTAAAQAYLLNRFNEEFIQTHEGAERLITVPTDYAGNDTTTYRERFADLVNEDIVVMWTGPAVVPEEITAEGAKKVSEIFKHDLLIWDNYPVNDFDRNRLFLGPLVKRDAELTENGVIGLTANPMNEAEASKIPLYTIADYTWNPYEYNPENSWLRSIESFGGEAAEALKTFAENSYSSRLTDRESLTLTPLIDEFWKVYETDHAEQAAEHLIAEFENLQTVPERLEKQMENEKFLNEIDPYLKKLSLSGKAGVTAVKLLMAEKVDDSHAADQYREELMLHINQLNDIPQEVGKFVIKPFLIQAIYGEYILSRPLDGINKVRGAGELIQYTPEHGDTTGTNIYGYEVTVEEGTIVKRGGNNSPIPDNGYVLSIHGSDWLMENALLGAKVQIKDGQVLITIPK
ncbi:beta-N-acetylglucosaminidase domain-containing protein [Halobacillus shinanisalinarum]|uniref:Beta-N-acetylglucosaminidase domain-containing protein n=1 Tax=Halobacillus shinanisalinarum TaxID=2932258 RepID=A0ABY4H0Q9_9BACI|nr:beta-N-acetylglucosaminidase domain-containing protein [Halobacillus shinanisalinarum]UOQ92587.1 beta-N-acetylglucosaminidase domain-containing protein [Halobacillus shinanisalinarum]